MHASSMYDVTKSACYPNKVSNAPETRACDNVYIRKIHNYV
jgi:hypothetical protein